MKRSTFARLVLALTALGSGALFNSLGDSTPFAPAAAPAPVAPYGSVIGRFVLDGKAPPRTILHKKGAPRIDACCVKEDLLSQDLVVDPKTHGIANVCVFLPRAKAIHPRFHKDKGKPLRQDVQGCNFVPRILVVQVGQHVRLTRSDKCAHVIKADLANDSSFAALLPASGLDVPVKGLPQDRSVPVGIVTCFLHRWMQSYWLVLDHPYGAVTDATGKFTLTDLPAGTHELRVWQEKSGWINKALTVTVQRGQTTDLGTLKVPMAKFREP